jgi:hypothetical protein
MINMPNNNNEVTTNELLEFMEENMATKADLRGLGEATKVDLQGLGEATKADLELVREDMATKADLGKMKHEIFDHQDEKMADLRGDLVVLMRKEDRKMSRLCEMLKEKDILADEEIQEILGMEPFPKLTL